MPLKSVARRGALAGVTLGAALALAACGAGQVSQTSDQVAAVDGAYNTQAAVPGEVAVRDAHILVDPDSGEAALKFSAVNQERVNAVYILDSIEVEGVGEAHLSSVGSTRGYKDAVTESGVSADADALVIPRNCSLIASFEDEAAQSAKNARDSETAAANTGTSGAARTNPVCAAYFSAPLKADSLVGEGASAAGENRTITFHLSKVSDGTREKAAPVELHATISAVILHAGGVERDEKGMLTTVVSPTTTSSITPSTSDSDTDSTPAVEGTGGTHR